MRLPFKRSVIAGGMVLALLLSACSSAFDDASSDKFEGATALSDTGTRFAVSEAPAGEEAEDQAELAANQVDRVVPFATGPAEIRVIRDGRVDIRIEKDDFSAVSTQLRTLAADLGGYVSSGETHLEEIEGINYTVGWFTLRIPEARFEEALSKVEAMGERLALNVSSQDVSEEFVDLEGRLSYWKSQEAFYLKLMDEATQVNQLVALQAQMQDVLLEIEAIEGRVRYLDSRTEFSTLTVGVTEVPGAVPIPVDEPAPEPNIITEAFEQAGTVLLSTMAFLIVATAFALPVAIVGLVAYAVWRVASGGRKDPEPTEA